MRLTTFHFVHASLINVHITHQPLVQYKSLTINNSPKLAKIYSFGVIQWSEFNVLMKKKGICAFNNLIFNDDGFAPVQVYHSDPVTNPNEFIGGDELEISGDELATVDAIFSDVSARLDLDNPAPSTPKVWTTSEMIRPFLKLKSTKETRNTHTNQKRMIT